MNPLAYLLISLQATSAMLSIIFLIAWLSFGRPRHALLWSMAFLVATTQWVMNLGSTQLFASYDLYWLSVNTTSIVTLSLAVAGHRLRVGLPNRVAWHVGAGLIIWLAVAWFTLVEPHVGLRTAIGPAYAALMMAVSIHAILRPGMTVAAEWALVAVSSIFAICELSAAIAILGGGATGNADATNLYQAINFLSLPAAYTGMGLFTVLILASDMSQKMKSLALTDPLTGVANVRGFAEHAQRALSASRRAGTPLSAIACDLDHFKSVNDQHGHASGDEALRHFAQHLVQHARGHDIIGRVGGEEFVILLPNTPLDSAAKSAERLRISIAPIAPGDGEAELHIKASFGVASRLTSDEDLRSLLSRADEALYRSKREGRDRVSVAEN